MRADTVFDTFPWPQSPTRRQIAEVAAAAVALRALRREQMRGREIIYRCRFPWLLRITSLKVDDDGFRAMGAPAQELPDEMLSQFLEKPLTFGARWIALDMSGSSIGMTMAQIPDRFWPDPAVVAAVKAAAARAASPAATREIRSAAYREMDEILNRAASE